MCPIFNRTIYVQEEGYTMSSKLNPQPEPPGITFILGLLQSLLNFIRRLFGIRSVG